MNVMKETLLREVFRTEEIMRQRDPQRWRMRFHIMPPAGWLNDPNGLCFYDGNYHFFFQYAPFDVDGGLKMWGQYCSKDLVHWEYAGTPILPDSPYDCHGVYSGCAFTEDGRMELFYTGNIKLDGDYDYTNNGRESNTIYISSADGNVYGDKECLLGMDDYPAEYTNHIRDPKVWKEDGSYFMVLGGRRKDGQGAVLLYRSGDKKVWKYMQELTTEKSFGYMWECPDLFSLDGERILSVSPQGLAKEEYRFQNIYQSGYFLLPENFLERKVSEEFTEWDLGFDFYAPQTFSDASGRRILVGWAGMPDCEDDYQNPTALDGWQHVFTIPRRLSWNGKKVCQYPVSEINALRRECKEFTGGQWQTQHMDSCFDWEVIDPDKDGFRITIEKECVIQYEKGIFSLEFTGELGAGRTIRKALIDSVQNVRILADTSLLEVFINEGEHVFTTRYYPRGETRILTYTGGGRSCLWSLCRENCIDWKRN
ncbi:MAG: sucrose-6-phosphate hydrolase [Blautia sp.]|jgi:beta-fructofuranosidase